MNDSEGRPKNRTGVNRPRDGKGRKEVGEKNEGRLLRRRRSRRKTEGHLFRLIKAGGGSDEEGAREEGDFAT